MWGLPASVIDAICGLSFKEAMAGAEGGVSLPEVAS